jgi:hypothetical protein
MKRMTMTHTLSRRRDRTGHWRQAAVLVGLLGLLPAAAAAQGSGRYNAQRFDVVATPSRGGDLAVTETIVFAFQSGTFRRVWRELPTSRTDGIDIVEGRMDGRVLPRGSEPLGLEVSGRSRVKVQWNFAPVGPSLHTFELRYVAHGVVSRQPDADVLRWRALPSEHRYTIDASRIVFAARDATPSPIESSGVAAAAVVPDPAGIAIEASGIRTNGSIVAELRYPAGEMIASAPAWQQRDERAAALGPRWLEAAAGLFAVALVLVFGARRGYSAPPAGQSDQEATSAPPEPLPAAVASVLAAKGQTSGFQAMATLVDLADRGVLTVRELPKSFGPRQYELSQVRGTHDLDEHEATALAIAFAGEGDDVTLRKARGRIARSGRRFVAALNQDLDRRGLIDPVRKALRNRMGLTSIAVLIASGVLCIPAATLVPRFQGWPFLLPLAVFVAGLIGIIVAASTSPLSDRGALEASRWLGFKRHLKMLANARDGGGGFTIESRWIVYAMAVGLASQWSRYLKAHPGAAPSWFMAAQDDRGGAFAAFVGSQGAASGHGSGGGSGAAGGGGSGAG